MLGRRQIREKVVENVYSYYQNPIKIDVLEKNMFSSIEKIYNLYVYELNFLIGLKNLAEHQMEIGKNKYFKTDSDINPNQKFINNQVLIKLEENPERLYFTGQNKDLKWDLHDDMLVKTFQRMTAGKRYQDFMKEEGYSFEEDQKFIGKLFLRYIAENEDLRDYITDKELTWADDIHIANSMLQKTIGAIRENEESRTLIKVLKDRDDEQFASKLLRVTLNNYEASEKKLGERLENWDLERVSVMDKVILTTAISELDNFHKHLQELLLTNILRLQKYLLQIVQISLSMVY